MTDRPLFPALRWAALAAVAGALAGVGAVYVRANMAGNAAAETAADPAADKNCAAKAAKAKAIGQAAAGEVAAMQAADPPVSLAGLAFQDGSGKRVTLADLSSGRTVLLNLWATWCAPCRAEMPALDGLQAEMGGEKFEVAAVNLDTGGPEKPRKFFEETGVKALASFRDPSLGVFNDLKGRGLVLGLPATFVVDSQGCMLAGMNGPAAWASPDAKRLIAVALKN